VTQERNIFLLPLGQIIFSFSIHYRWGVVIAVLVSQMAARAMGDVAQAVVTV